MNSSPCLCSSLSFSIDHSPCSSMDLSMSYTLFRGLPTVSWTYPWPRTLRGLPVLVWTFQARASSEVYLLWHGLIHSHSHIEVYLLWHGLFHWPQPLQRSLQTHAVLWSYLWLDTLRYSGMAFSMEMNTASCTSCGMDFSMAMDASRCTCSGVALSMARDASGCTLSHVGSSTGHSPSDWSSVWSSRLSNTAAQEQQRCPGRQPAQAPGSWP